MGNAWNRLHTTAQDEEGEYEPTEEQIMNIKQAVLDRHIPFHLKTIMKNERTARA